MNAIATTEFNPSLAIINGIIKTTSLKVSEHFGKQHKSVLRSIKNLECSSEFSGRNFALTSSDIIQPNGGLRKEPSYEMTKDGFTFLAMGFTGKQAAQWKEAYINAFNLMAAQLQKPYGLKSLPPSPHISESEASQFKKSIEALCGSNRKRYSELYRKIYDYYEITGYKNIPAGKLEEAAKLIGMTLLPLGKPKMPVEPFTLSFTPEELEDLVVERIKAFEGELLPRQEAPKYNSIMINLAPLDPGQVRRWIVSQLATEAAMFHAINSDQQIMTLEEARIKLIKDGYIVMKEADILNRLK